ncbi:hypothetical protein GE061_005715 [Apolygus lucorum]|uniref:DNA-directed RNA polymerase I subunit RPA43 n=1 Tax=Apolygus lucorum TaxID=248454 RepID=A0A8S9WYS5_APOLU|nr:hypothetical protein GE061_005715 [Apolygus lucorum]
MLERDNACVSCVSCQRSIDITPMHLGDLKTSIRNLLDEKVTKYDVELQGVVLAHKNVKIVAESVVLSDSRSFPLEYVADIYVFKPKIGSKLTGVVNKIPMNREYVSVLVHRIFNVVVYAAHKQPKPAVNMGSSINVTVTYIDFTGRLPFIKAEISSGDLNVHEQAYALDGDLYPKSLHTPKRKGLTSILKNSPARQSSTEIETESSCAENGTASQELNSSRVGETHNRKKKKKRDKERQEEQESEKTSSKKRKRSHGEEEEPSSSSKKKKKKHSDRSREDESYSKGNGVSLNVTPINPLENTEQIIADQSIFKAASSTPVLGPPATTTKKRKKNSLAKGKTEVPEMSEIQMTIARVKSELRTADSGISSSDEKKSDESVKVKRESVASQDNQSSSKCADDSSTLKEDGGKKKKKKKKDRKSETPEDITRRLLEEALKDLKTEKRSQPQVPRDLRDIDAASHRYPGICVT